MSISGLESGSLLLLLLLTSVSCLPQPNYCASQEFRRTWAPDHYKIYATDMLMRLEPGETLALMRRLLANYEKSGCLEEAPKSDGGTRRRADMLRQLVTAGELAQSEAPDCGIGPWARLATLNQLIKQHQPYQVNVVPLLEAGRRRLLERCSARLERHLRALFETAASDKVRVDGEFVELAHKELARDFHVPELVEWLLALIEARFDRRHGVHSSLPSISALIRRDTPKPAAISIQELEGAFDRFVSHSCGLFNEHLQAELRRPFCLSEGEHFRQLQEQTKDLELDKWLQYSRVCIALSEQGAELKRRLVLASLVSDRKLRSL